MAQMLIQAGDAYELKLPSETIIDILALVRSASDLWSVCLCNKIFNSIARPYLYRHIYLPYLGSTHLVQLCTLLCSKPEVAQYVRSVKGAFFNPHSAKMFYPAAIRMIIRTICRMPHVNSIELGCGTTMQELIYNLPACSRKLQNLSLSYVGRQLGDTICSLLEQQTSLTHLTLSAHPSDEQEAWLTSLANSTSMHLSRLQMAAGDLSLHVLVPGRPVREFAGTTGEPVLDLSNYHVILHNLSQSCGPLRVVSFTLHSLTLDMLRLMATYLRDMARLCISLKTALLLENMMPTSQHDDRSIPMFHKLEYLGIGADSYPVEWDAYRPFVDDLFRSSHSLQNLRIGGRLWIGHWGATLGQEHIFYRHDFGSKISTVMEDTDMLGAPVESEAQ